MIDIDHLESLAKAASASSVWWTEKALRHATGNLVGEQDIALWATASPAAILELCAEVRALREDKERLDSGCIMTNERDEFGDEYRCERRGSNLRQMIDDAMEAAKK